jgi:hypothetical protein
VTEQKRTHQKKTCMTVFLLTFVKVSFVKVSTRATQTSSQHIHQARLQQRPQGKVAFDVCLDRRNGRGDAVACLLLVEACIKMHKPYCTIDHHLLPHIQHVGTFCARVPFMWAPGIQVHSPPPCIEMTSEDCAPASIITRCLTCALSLHGLALGEVEVKGLISYARRT